MPFLDVIVTAYMLVMVVVFQANVGGLDEADDVKNVSEQFLCHIYGSKVENVTDLRYILT